MSELVKQLRWDQRYTNGHVPVTMEEAARALEAQSKRIAELEALCDSQSLLLAHSDSALAELQTSLADSDEALQILGLKLAQAEAKIDALMLEYCPDEMTPEQIENWGKHQRRVSPERTAEIDRALALGRPPSDIPERS